MGMSNKSWESKKQKEEWAQKVIRMETTKKKTWNMETKGKKVNYGVDQFSPNEWSLKEKCRRSLEGKGKHSFFAFSQFNGLANGDVNCF